MNFGKKPALDALSGKASERVPVALFTWGFDYLWKVAGLEPWKLAVGGSDTWHRAHMALLNRHHPDVLFYTGAGEGPKEPTLLEENSERWIVRNNNNNLVYALTKDSLSLYVVDTHAKACDPVGRIESFNDADRLIEEFKGWGSTYLNGLRRLVDEVGDRALVLPHHSPAYICGCYALGFESAMYNLVENPDLFSYVCEKFRISDDLRMSELAQAGAQAVFIADGWASCDIISPSMFKEYALPYQVSITQSAHAAGLKIILWNEGDILPILAQEVGVGMDAFAFEQPRKCIDISVDKVREAFGASRCLFGNLDSELLLMRNNPEEIKREVELQIRMSGRGAPFILSTGSPLPSNIDPDIFDRVVDAARSFKW
jgi:hypothetical protein